MTSQAAISEDQARPRSDLTPQQQAAKSLAEAASHLGISRRTLHRWLKQDDFAEPYHKARRQQRTAAAARKSYALIQRLEALEASRTRARAGRDGRPESRITQSAPTKR